MGAIKSKNSGPRRCFLVLRHLQGGDSEAGLGERLEWRVIGNHQKVPQLDKECTKEPRLDQTWNRECLFTQHWALCVLPPGNNANPTRRKSRAAFLDADYFDLGAESTQRATFSIIRASASHVSFSHSSTKWQPSVVADISSLVEIGETSRPIGWILKEAHRLVHNWGTYRPILWNCQHFALFIAQIALDSANFARIATMILAARSRWVDLLVSTRNDATLGATIAAMFCVPIVGIATFIGGNIINIMDSSRWEEIQSKWEDFCEKHRPLRKINFVWDTIEDQHF